MRADSYRRYTIFELYRNIFVHSFENKHIVCLSIAHLKIGFNKNSLRNLLFLFQKVRATSEMRFTFCGSAKFHSLLRNNREQSNYIADDVLEFSAISVAYARLSL